MVPQVVGLLLPSTPHVQSLLNVRVAFLLMVAAPLALLHVAMELLVMMVVVAMMPALPSQARYAKMGAVQVTKSVCMQRFHSW